MKQSHKYFSVLFVIAGIIFFIPAHIRAAQEEGWTTKTRMPTPRSELAANVNEDYASPISAAELIAYWDFDEASGSTVSDKSANSNNGQLSGGVISSGKFGQGMTCNGYGMTVPNNPTINSFPGGFTFAAWAKPTSFPDQMNIFWKTDRYNRVHMLHASIDNRMYAAMNREANQGGFEGMSGSVVPLNQWSHLAWTYDEQNFRFYHNGVEIFSAPYTEPWVGNNIDLLIGQHQELDFAGFHGVLDEVRIYRGALDIQQIQGLVRGPLIWVDAGHVGDPTEDGSADHPFDTIQDAIDVAGERDMINVVQGIYTSPSGNIINWQNKNLTLTGGYEFVEGAKNPSTFQTVIDGDNIAGRSCIVTEGLDAVSTLSGFILRGCNAHTGGGMYNLQSNLVISDCAFENNYADYGGGLYNKESSPALTKCVFRFNTTDRGGAGLYNFSNSSPAISSSFFIENLADWGGGMYNSMGSNPRIENCIFDRNEADGHRGYNGQGGGMVNYASNATVVNSTFNYNTSLTLGDAIYSLGGSHVTVINSIFRDTSNDEIFTYNFAGASTSVTYSNVQGGYTGIGNINADPLFANALAGDFHLLKGSPSIDTGTSQGAPQFDIEGNPRPQGLGFDMGAYESFGAKAKVIVRKSPESLAV